MPRAQWSAGAGWRSRASQNNRAGRRPLCFTSARTERRTEQRTAVRERPLVVGGRSVSPAQGRSGGPQQPRRARACAALALVRAQRCCGRRVADGATPSDYDITCPSTDSSTACPESSDGSTLEFTHQMTIGKPNPFAPFSKKLSVEFTRAFDNAKITFERHVLILGVIEEEVPEVWTTAVDGLIFSILRDPPGGASTATLVEGSTISTSMSIDGAHAATLEESRNDGSSGGVQGSLKFQASAFGIGTVWNGFGVGTKHGNDWSESHGVTVDRGSSTHFDVGLSFDVAISTSDSPYQAGQPSDVIIGGGANLRFISAIEVPCFQSP